MIPSAEMLLYGFAAFAIAVALPAVIAFAAALFEYLRARRDRDEVDQQTSAERSARGRAGRGQVRPGTAWQGSAWLGSARHGVNDQSTTRKQ